MFIKNALITSTILLATATSAQAAAVLATSAQTTYNFTNSGTSSTEIGSGYGNALDFGDLTVSAWATTGVPNNTNSLIADSQVLRFTTGLGACNREEVPSCVDPKHQVDNVSDDDLILFVFDQQVQFDDILIDPYGTYDRDVSFWIADITSTDLTGLDPNSLRSGTSAFGAITDDFNSTSNAPLSIDLGGATGNALLFSAYLNLTNDPNNSNLYDRFKITSLTTTSVVPVPAAVWLFGSGLLGLVGVARRKTA